MTQEVEKTETKTAPAKKSPPVKRQKAAPKPKPKKVAAKAKAPVVNPHVEAGVDVSTYKGLSSFINKTRKTQIMLGISRPAGKLTGRMQGALYAVRKAYGNKPFIAQGFDNGVLRDLLAAGLIKCDGGQKQGVDGKEYLMDGATQVKVHLTAAGMNYGKA